MQDFFSNLPSQPIEWFGLTHILLILGFFLLLALLWILAPKIRAGKHEKVLRIIMIVLTILFEWRVFESRILNGSIFRLPLCGIALYGLLYSVAFKNKNVFYIIYFYAFGTLLTYLFFDTPWGLDRWDGWTYFGAHAMIGLFAVYGYRVHGFTPKKKDLLISMGILAIYGFISGYATFKYGGSDELFLQNPPVDFLQVFKDIHQVLYISIMVILAAILMLGMYSIIYLAERSKNKHLPSKVQNT